ncbi:MAG: beta-N-acetylhexosaminidase, partial [Pedobacter sp.]
MRLIALLFLAVISTTTFAQQVSIIPQPASLQVNDGSFTINKSTPILITDEGDRKSANFLNAYLKEYYGFLLPIKKQNTGRGIRLITRKFIKAPEKDAYLFESNSTGVKIEGDTYPGTFYGIQTLIQLLPVEKKQSLVIAAVSIADAPQLGYRGMHLDVCRHFFPIAYVKKYIDFLALHKLNRFHWHLTDDQGWRIEIKKYPKLTAVGGWRNGTIIGRYPGKGNDSIHYGGFYTQAQIKEVVKYAADRFITVIPEIEMPGHAGAAIAAYPNLSCFPETPTKATYPKNCAWAGDSTGKQTVQTWGVFEDVFCAGNENTFRFLQDVVDEVMPLFPSVMFHVGGDECPKANWKKCPQCQQRMKNNNLKDEHELQSYFVQRMEKYINAKGKTIIGWDEILEGGLAPNAWVMSWRGEKGGIEAAKQHHNVIMTPQSYVYFDHTQSRNEDSVTIGGYNNIEKVYNWNPVPAELSAEEAKYIKGGQANLWTEYVKNTKKIEYSIFPRMAALSETLWGDPAKKNWPDFEKRLPVQLQRYDRWNANYSRAYYDMQATVIPASEPGKVMWKLENKANLPMSFEQNFTSSDLMSQSNTTYTSPIVIDKNTHAKASINLQGRAITIAQS